MWPLPGRNKELLLHKALTWKPATDAWRDPNVPTTYWWISYRGGPAAIAKIKAGVWILDNWLLPADRPHPWIKVLAGPLEPPAILTRRGSDDAR